VDLDVVGSSPITRPNVCKYLDEKERLPCQPGERGSGSVSGPSVQTAVEKKRFNPKKPNREDRPHTDYRVHPPIRENAEPAPELGLLDYVNAGRANQQDPDPRLRDEAALDRLEGCQPVGTQFTAADRRQQRRGHDRNATDPNNHCENMQGAAKTRPSI
jgi:hypothetical protein